MQIQTIAHASHQPRQSLSVRFRYLVAGFHLLVVFWVLSAFFPAQGLSVVKVITSAFLLLAVILFALQIATVSSKSRAGKIDLSSRLLLALLFFWCLITIIRGFESDTGRLFTLLANPEIGGLVWLLPFAIYIGRQHGVLQALLPAFRLHAVVGIALVFWTIAEVGAAGVMPKDSSSKVGLILLYAAPVVLLTGIGKRLDRWLYISGLGISAIAHFLLSNRAGFAMTILVLALVLVLGRVRNLKKIKYRLLTFVIVSASIISFGVSYVLSQLSEEWFSDTRTFLFLEMLADFNQLDWLVGRGALGSYYSPFFDYTSRMGMEGDSSIRQVNEIGYLHIALKAGLIGVILYFVVVLRAAYLSLGIQDKRFAIGLLALFVLHLAEMAVVGQASFQPARVLLWMLIGIALTQQRALLGHHHLR